MIIKVVVYADNNHKYSKELEISRHEFIRSNDPKFIFEHNFDLIKEGISKMIFKGASNGTKG